MNLGEAGITKERATFISAIGSGDVATACVGRKEKNIAVTAGRENYGVAVEGIDPALGRNGMGATRRILITKTFHLIPKLAQSGRGRSAGQSRTDHNDFKFAAIIRANETRIILVVPPFLLERTGRNFAVEFSDHNFCAGWMRPSKTATGMAV